MSSRRIQTGLDRCCQELSESLRHGNVGLLFNQASVNSNLRLACDVLAPLLGSRLKKLFSPQHGLWGEEQANMIESPHRHYEPLGLPVYSLYSETRRPTPEMISDLDCLVIDLQDVGTRVYTFVWTMLECLHACAEAGIRVVILDRPNPLGNQVVEGPILSPKYRSFVGNAQIPMRHGLTMGDLARLFVLEQDINVDLQVVDVLNIDQSTTGWDTSSPWVPPSPNMPRLETAVLYPGQVLLEGTNLSEGRGTTYPFEVVGAPFLDGHSLAAELSRREFPGVIVRPVRFRPTFDKWANQICEGVRLHVTDFAAVRSFELTVAILQHVQQFAGEEFQWLSPPYEYEYELAPIDILYGSDRLRRNLTGESTSVLSACDQASWRERLGKAPNDSELNPRPMNLNVTTFAEPTMNARYPFMASSRHVLAVVVALICGSISAGQQEDLASRLEPLIENHKGNVAVSVLHLKTGDRFDYRSTEVMPTASLIKLPVMIEAYRQIAAGDLSPDTAIVLAAGDKVPGSGILTKHFSEGSELKLRDAIQLMIGFSDNTATNLVIDQIGLPATAKTMAEMGYPETKLHSKVYRGSETIFPDRSQKYGLGSTTASDIVSLLESLHKRELVSPEYSDIMLKHLRDCEAKAQLPRLLPPNVEIAHKSGAVSNARCDAGIIYAKNGPLAVCMLTSQNEDRRWTKDNAAELLNARIAKTVYDYFNPPDAASPAVKMTLRTGDFGKRVEALQRTLNARLNPSPQLSVDGDFGPATAKAVLRFQAANDINEAGVVASVTWEKLSPILTQPTPVPDPAVVNAEKLIKAPADLLSGLPFVTSKAWAVQQVVGEGTSTELIAGHNADQPLEIASTTKVMTAYLVLRYAAEHPEVLNEVVTFSRRADRTRGSTAGIAEGESLPVSELLYGLMLPSGNDASVALAEHFGPRVANRKESEISDDADPLKLFVAAMNLAASELGMTQTVFRNPHGLSHAEHRSTASDLLKLAQAAIQVPLFRDYISTRQRGCTVTGAAGYRRNVVWRNTNRLLKIDGYAGVKTGTTDAAGACLISLSHRDNQELLLVVLGSASSATRYTDSRNLFRWAWNELARSNTAD